MANEITASAQLAVRSGNLDQTVSKRAQFDLTDTTPPVASGVATIGTTHEAIPMGDVSTAGWCFLMNVGATNEIEVGVDVSSTFYPFASLEPGEFAVLPLGTNAPYAKADTAAEPLEYRIYER